MNLWYGADGYWRARAYYPGAQSMSGNVMFCRFSASSVSFTITWATAPAGIYDGRIGEYGFISGVSRDRWSFARATWRCATSPSAQGDRRKPPESPLRNA